MQTVPCGVFLVYLSLLNVCLHYEVLWFHVKDLMCFDFSLIEQKQTACFNDFTHQQRLHVVNKHVKT